MGYVSPEEMLAALSGQGIDVATLSDSLAVLEHQGHLELVKTLGRGPYDARIKSRGISLMLGPKQAELVSQVGLAILNQELTDSDDISKAIGVPLPLVNHAIGRLEGEGHLGVSKLLAGTVLVHTVNPTLRRVLGA